MIIAHVWDYSFDPRNERRRRARAPRAGEDRQGLRPEDDSHRAGHRLCSPGGVNACSTRSASAWRCGTRVVFVASSLALIALTYLLLALSLASTTARSSRARCCSTRPRTRSGGLDALAREIQRTQAAGGPNHFRAHARHRAGRHLPEHARGLAPFDLSQLATPPLSGQQLWAAFDMGERRTMLEVASLRLRGRHARSRSARAPGAADLLRASGALLLVTFASIVSIGLAGGSLLTRSALSPSARLARPCSNPSHRAHRHTRAGQRHRRRARPAGRAVQRHARAHRRRRRRHARSPRQRGARPAHAADAPARAGRDGACRRTIRDASRRRWPPASRSPTASRQC